MKSSDLPPPPLARLEATARALVAAGKGILAADESTRTIEKRFAARGIPCTPETRRNYREMLIGAPGLAAFISGVILFDETIRQQTDDGSPFAARLAALGLIPGIKVDRGTVPLAGFPDEVVTEGLDGLRERLREYAAMGARFTKWRAVIAIGPEIPTTAGVAAAAENLGRYAALSQEAGLVPVVEPEILMDGPHDLARHAHVTEWTLRHVFHALAAHRVGLEGMVLKTNMVLAGTEYPQPAPVTEVAATTLSCLRRVVPAAVPGIAFLSGGQPDLAATAHLDAMNRLGPAPWELSFSYGRALQAPALQCWAGRTTRIAAAQAALLHRARCNSAARFGRYDSALEAEGTPGEGG